MIFVDIVLVPVFTVLSSAVSFQIMIMTGGRIEPTEMLRSSLAFSLSVSPE